MGTPARRDNVGGGRFGFGLRGVVGERDVHARRRERARDGRADALSAGDQCRAADHVRRYVRMRPMSTIPNFSLPTSTISDL